MKKTIVLIMFFTLFYYQTLFAETTTLSKTASNLKIDMSRETVISLLGYSTWAVIPSDKGSFELTDSSISLELYWKNRPCSPVVVQFSRSYKVIGWSEGRSYCGKDVLFYELSKEYSCAKSDRVYFCK